MGSIWNLNERQNRENFDAHISGLLLAGKQVRVEVLPEKRSLDQNALIRALYREIASQIEDQSVIDIERFCKLHYGVPILREHFQGFKDMYDKGIKKTLSYEEKLAAMDYLPVTRLFSTKQATEYIDTVIREYSQRGISIVMPGEL